MPAVEEERKIISKKKQEKAARINIEEVYISEVGILDQKGENWVNS